MRETTKIKQQSGLVAATGHSQRVRMIHEYVVEFFERQLRGPTKASAA
jgi:hypothetical protein